MSEREALLREIYRHSDLEQRLSVLPPSGRARGLFFQNIEAVARGMGKADALRAMFPRHRTAMLWYSLREYLEEMACAAALLSGPERMHHGLALIGRRNALAFAESLLGRTMLRLLSRDPVKLLRQGVAAHRQGVSVGQWTLEITSERSATMHMKEEYAYIESHYVGAAEGTFEVIGLEVDVQVELDDPYNGRHLLRW